jgi:transposase
MPVPNDPGRCRTALDPESTLVAVIEMSQSSWLVAAIVPGLERHPLKKLAVDEAGLLRQLERWREEAARAGRRVTRIAVAFEAGRDGFWLARWLRARGVETADMLVHEILSRGLRDRRAVARYAGLTGAPDESGARRREKGLAKAGNARVRRGMVQLAWRFLVFQKQSALAQWYRARTADARPGTRKTLIVALARKLLLALWRFATTGQPPAGVALRPGMTAAG